MLWIWILTLMALITPTPSTKGSRISTSASTTIPTRTTATMTTVGTAMIDPPKRPTCIHCGAARVLDVVVKCSDAAMLRMNGISHDGYMPHNLGLGGGDYLEFAVCLECARLQRTGPVGHTKFDPPARRKKSTRKAGVPLGDLQQLEARWPGQCACGAAFAQFDPIVYSLIARHVVGCPSCEGEAAKKCA